MRACVGNEKEKERVGQKQTNDAQKKQKKTNSTKAQKQRAESRSKSESRGRLGIEQRKGGARLYGGTVAKAEERRKGGDGSIVAGACTWLKGK